VYKYVYLSVLKITHELSDGCQSNSVGMGKGSLSRTDYILVLM